MNQQSKRAIKSLVLTLRHKLEEEIEIQLKRYGFAGERWLPLERLPHIQRDDGATIEHFRLKAALEQHLRRIGTELDQAEPEQRAEAAGWFVREVAFTHLNRLVALKCLEVRELIPEIITTRDAYGGRSRTHYDYRNAHPDEANCPDDALAAAIKHASRGVYAEFKFLFDVGDPSAGRQPPAEAILWPSYPMLKECITLINGLDAAAGNGPGRDDPAPTLWAEDEIIGWFYQFYNAEHKEAVRKRGRPRRPAEVAVINQFFTPRWIVKYLVDNTLGRLWLEMHPDSERVRAKCDYLVPEPLSAEGDRITLDPDSPINDPKAPARREPKLPQELRLIDPACGTMHFGHYAFEVFQEIYRDARERNWVTGEDALPDAIIPAAILRHNLYGVDIDLRAVQLAGLSLFMKAKGAEPKALIAQVNLVVADAVLPADGARQQFLEQYRDDKVVQEAVRQVLDEMANVAEVGSLLRVEQRLHEILGKAGHLAVQDLDIRRQRELPGVVPVRRQLSLVEAPGVTPEGWGAHYTLARLLADLRAFAAQALQTHDLNAQLFAQEAEKTVHLLDVFLNDYDVVVMNPPYNYRKQITPACLDYLDRSYKQTKANLYSAFIERSFDLLGTGGYLGALTPRTFMYQRSYSQLRKDFLGSRSRLTTLAEYGLGILDDATERPASFVLQIPGIESVTMSVFFDLREPADQREEMLGESIHCLRHGQTSQATFLKPSDFFLQLPDTVIMYRIIPRVLEVFSIFSALDCDQLTREEKLNRVAEKIADVKIGFQTSNDERFVRRFWEVSSSPSQWKPFAKGGTYSAHYKDIELVVKWGLGGGELRKLAETLRGRGRPIFRNEQFYFQPGLTLPKVSELGMGVRFLGEDTIFAQVAPSIFPKDFESRAFLCGLLNSRCLEYCLRVMTPARDRIPGVLGRLPIFHSKTEARNRLVGDCAVESHDLKAAWDTGNEASTRFETPWLVQFHKSANQQIDESSGIGNVLSLLEDDAPEISWTAQSTLAALLGVAQAIEYAVDARLTALQAHIDEAVYSLYEISSTDHALIERELGQRPPELVWPQMERKSDTEKRREHVRRLVSYFLLEALTEDRDGIIPLTSGTGHASALDVIRVGLEAEFGETSTFQMETDIKKELGRDIESWLDRDYWKWHIKLYKRRPMIWHLSSPGNHFACFLHIHKLDGDTLRKVQTQYLWNARRSAQSELDSAKAAQQRGESGASSRVDAAEIVLEDLTEFERRLLSVIQAEVECEIPDWAEGPFRNGVYDPVLDDGIKVNITPLQAAGVLRVKRVV